jgi:hypothetical protein
MTTTPLSSSPITASIQCRYLTGTGYLSPTATVSTAFDRQNLEHRLPDHRADPIRGSQNRALLVDQPSTRLQLATQIE